MIGRIAASERYKGHDQLIDVWPRIAARHADARLVFVGDGDDRLRLTEKVAALDISESVEFAGRVTDQEMARELERASIFAMPSRNEGFGLVFLEAMAAGLPCIAGNMDAARETILDQQTGLLVNPDDLNALTNSMLELLDDPSRSTRLGHSGYTRWRDEFTFEPFRVRTLHACGLRN
jgi:phosphatidylinositol alpha-1,6-mannosyltransferase